MIEQTTTTIDKEYMFPTREEYENYIQLLYDLISSRAAKHERELDETDLYSYTKCDDCKTNIRHLNPRYRELHAETLAFQHCLPLFSIAHQKTQRDKKIVDALLTGQY